MFDKDYHNKDKREKSLTEISRELAIPFADITMKLLTLRSLLGRERAKISKTKSGQSLDDLYKPTWIYWDRLQFLQAVMQLGKSKDNLQGQEDKEQISSTEASTHSEDFSTPVSWPNSGSITPKATKKSLDIKKQELLTTCINVLKQPEPKPKKTRSYFSLYITEKPSKVNARDRLLAEKRISDVIFDMEIKNQQMTSQQAVPNENSFPSNPACMQTKLSPQRDGASYMALLQ